MVERTVAPGEPPPVLRTCAPVPADRPLTTNRDVEQLAAEALRAHRNCATVVAGWTCFWSRAQAAIENKPAPVCVILGEPKP